MGRTVYSPTFTIKNQPHVGKYTVRPMDPSSGIEEPKWLGGAATDHHRLPHPQPVPALLANLGTSKTLCFFGKALKENPLTGSMG